MTKVNRYNGLWLQTPQSALLCAWLSAINSLRLRFLLCRVGMGEPLSEGINKTVELPRLPLEAFQRCTSDSVASAANPSMTRPQH